MRFEFDINKSKSNKIKHGIDFVEAQELWEDSNIIEFPAKTVDENRHIVIGKINKTYWTGIITFREKNIRIISVRRSRLEEIKIYES